MAKIPGGYYIKARCIQQSAIAHQPPHYREVWDWLIANANHAPQKVYGKTIRRGQLHCIIDDIREGLHWYVGYRKMQYKKHDCENAMKWLTKAEMITTTKTGRGVIVTILNYDTYQNPKNYESRSESRTDNDNHAETMPEEKQELKNEENVNNEEEKLLRFRAAPDESYNAFLLAWHSRYGRFPSWAEGHGSQQEFVTLAKLVKKLKGNKAKLLECYKLMLADDDRYLVENGHRPSLLTKRLDKYLNQLEDTGYQKDYGFESRRQQ